MAIKYNSNYNGTIPFSDECRKLHLTANNVLSFAVPGLSSKNFQLIFGLNITSNIFIGYNVTPTIPAGNTINSQQYVEFNVKEPRTCKGGDVISLITPDANAYCSVSIREIP